MPNPIIFTSALPPEDLRFESMTASAGLSMLGEIRLNLISKKPDLMPEDLLGKTATITMSMRDDAKRHFHGYVTRFGIGPHRGHHYGYQATVRPWLWFLTRTADCRIFQEETVPDIVKKVFQDHGIANFEFKTFRTYRKWTYCVQYRESDYNFIARLLEHEGIYWYFEHTDSAHKLVLVDSQSAHDAAPGCAGLPYLKAGATAAPELEFISNWSFARQVKTGAMATSSYDFERPSTSLKTQTVRPFEHELADHEVFDYQGDFIQVTDGTQLTENRVDELHAQYELLRGTSNAYGLCCGHLLKMTRHPRDDQNAEYLVTSETIDAQLSTGQGDGSGQGYHCSFSAIPSSQQFRPPRRTPKPFVQGPQTAVVVGPSGEEIFTDKYGRVKVQFHWDRYGAKNEKSSCWTRVSSPWAGKSFGFVQIPRIGQEVVVDFLEGDPDQPLITGRVYNAEQMPPWELPANATQSGVLTRSSKGGAYANANALRFEDKKGSEQLWLHAEKNQDIEVENDETHWVGHDRTKTVDHDETVHVKHDRTETVDNNETITIGVDRKEKVGKNETIDIGVNRTETVGANEKISVGGHRNILVSLAASESVGLAKALSIGLGYQVSVGAAMNETVVGMKATEVGGYRTEMVGLYKSTKVGKEYKVVAGKAVNLNTGKSTLTMKDDGHIDLVGTEIKLHTGAGSILIKDDGTIEITGTDIKLSTGAGTVQIKKDGKIEVAGTDCNMKASAGKVHIDAGGIIEIKGPMVKINT